METRADQIFDAFKVFHRANPEIWVLFQKYSLQIIDRGLKSYGSAAVFERIRWHISVETSGKVKLNNNFRAYYARMFAVKYPEYSHFFRNRKRISENKDAYKNDVQEWSISLPAQESILLKALEALC